MQLEFGGNTRAKDLSLRFHGKGYQLLWRIVVAVLLSILILPIPWVCLWYTRWIVQNVTIVGDVDG